MPTWIRHTGVQSNEAHPAGSGHAAAPLVVLAVALGVVDVLVIAGYLRHLLYNDAAESRDPVFSAETWNGNIDGSFAEFLGHVQLICACVALFFLWRAGRTAAYGAWGLAFAAVVADDLFMLHERGGRALAQAFAVPAVSGLRPQDLGELAVWALMGAIIAPLLLVTHLRAGAGARRRSLTLLALVAALAAFAVAVDLVHTLAKPWVPPLADTAVAVLEATGELSVMTLILLAVSGMVLEDASRSARRASGTPRPRSTSASWDTAGIGHGRSAR
ncbi:MAG TPA: hypothetical protein VFH03_04505 [Actinoplanes sp.]|nr:hypothetical protein [Actinoplanes sp.]